jgi:hypothetical protein
MREPQRHSLPLRRLGEADLTARWKVAPILLHQRWSYEATGCSLVAVVSRAVSPAAGRARRPDQNSSICRGYLHRDGQIRTVDPCSQSGSPDSPYVVVVAGSGLFRRFGWCPGPWFRRGFAVVVHRCLPHPYHAPPSRRTVGRLRHQAVFLVIGGTRVRRIRLITRKHALRGGCPWKRPGC